MAQGSSRRAQGSTKNGTGGCGRVTRPVVHLIPDKEIRRRKYKYLIQESHWLGVHLVRALWVSVGEGLATVRVNSESKILIFPRGGGGPGVSKRIG